MIVYNGTQFNMLAGRLTGVLDNCFTVGRAGERGRSIGGRREKKGGEKRQREGMTELKIERENREWGHLSLLLIGYQAAHSLSLSLSPPRLVVWLFCYLPPYLIRTAIFGSVTTTTMSFIKRSSNSVSSPGLIMPYKQWWWSSSEALTKLKSCISFIRQWQAQQTILNALSDVA